MRVHVLQNEENEFIGSMLPWFEEKKYCVSTTLAYRNEELPKTDEFDWLVIMGGSMSVYEAEVYAWIEKTKDLIRSAILEEKRVLGICLGGQLIASALGAKVYQNNEKEIGWFPITKTNSVATWLPEDAPLLCWHGDIFELPEKATAFGKTDVTPCQGFTISDRVWALQFHLEVNEATPDIFLEASGGELGNGTYIQSFEEIRDASVQIAQSQKIMHQLLDKIDAA